jgi:ABC-type nickel/cobalt efflux system permease component RcnA
MTTAAPALIAAAAGVGFGHAILPDHWVPLAVVGRTRRYPLARVARLSSLAGVAHVLVSIILGAIIIAIGLQFRSTVQSAQDTIIGAILILTGLAFAALELTGHRHHHDHEHGHHHHGHHEHSHHHHDHHEHGHTHAHHRDHGSEQRHARPDAKRGLGGLAAIIVPFGAAASPDLTILPVFLAATAAGITTAIVSLLVFAAVTIATIVGLTLFACFTGYQVRGEWLERRGNAFTALALIMIGALVLGGAI